MKRIISIFMVLTMAFGVFPPLQAAVPWHYIEEASHLEAPLPLIPLPTFTPAPEPDEKDKPDEEPPTLPFPMPSPEEELPIIPLPTAPPVVLPIPPLAVPTPPLAVPAVPTPPATPAFIVPARDISPVPIAPAPHPTTTIISVTTPQMVGFQVYSIHASTPITAVERMLLYDNRLVIDIPNSVSAFTGDVPVMPYLPVRGIRKSQFEERITRVVFDLQDGVEFTLTLSTDRTTIFLMITQGTLESLSFAGGTSYDLITLNGVLPAALQGRIQPGRISFHIANKLVPPTEYTPEKSAFVQHLSLTQRYTHAGILELEVADFTEFTLLQTGPNQTSIWLHAATYQNIWYENGIFRIARTEGFQLNLEYVAYTDLYHQRQYILSLPGNDSAHLGYGVMNIEDRFIRTLTIAPSAGGTIHLIFDTAQILAFDVLPTDDYYLIRALHPRQKYPRIVILDPGHGGHDPGAVRANPRGPGNIYEKDLNMAVLDKLLQLIEADGFIRAYTTRNTDVFVELVDRARFGNAIGDIFVSIHHNAARNTHVHGVETFYRLNAFDEHRTLTSQTLSGIMQRQLVNQTGAHGRRYRSMHLAVLSHSVIPATLVEIGFMSNPAELLRITDPAYQWRAARAIYYGLLQSFAIFDPPR